MLVIQYSYILIELAREYYDFYLVGISSFLVTEIIMTLITVYNPYHSYLLSLLQLQCQSYIHCCQMK